MWSYVPDNSFDFHKAVSSKPLPLVINTFRNDNPGVYQQSWQNVTVVQDSLSSPNNTTRCQQTTNFVCIITKSQGVMVAPLQNGCNCIGQILPLCIWMTAILLHCCGFFLCCWFYKQYQQYISVFNELLKMCGGGVQKTSRGLHCPRQHRSLLESKRTKWLLSFGRIRQSWVSWDKSSPLVCPCLSAKGGSKDFHTQRTCPLPTLTSKLPPPLTLITNPQSLRRRRGEDREYWRKGRRVYVCLAVFLSVRPDSSRTRADRLESCFSRGRGRREGGLCQWQFSSSITSITMVLGPVRMRLLTVR